MSARNSLTSEQNRLRGAISSLQTRGKNARSMAVGSRTAIRKALLDTRENLPLSLRGQFFDWLDTVGGSQNPTLDAALRTDLTSSIILSETLPVPQELDWIKYRTRPYIEHLRLFRKTASQIRDAFWAGDQVSTKERIEFSYNSFGPSLWLFFADLAIMQDFEGLEAQKETLSKIRNQYPGGLPAYLSYHVSVRNEPRSSYEVFEDEFRQRLSKESLDPSIETYLLYKVIHSLQLTDASISTVLRLEQAQSIIDVYETTIDVFQRLLGAGATPAWSPSAVSLLESWAGIGDWRVDKLLFGFTGRWPMAPNKSGELPIIPSSAPSDFDVMSICAELLEFNLNPHGDENHSGPRRDVEGDLKRLFSRDDKFEETRTRLLKFSRNFAFDTHSKAIGSAAAFATMSVENRPQSMGAIALNSPSRTAADSTYLRQEHLQGGKVELATYAPPHQIQAWLGTMRPEHEPTVKPFDWYLYALRLRTIDDEAALDAIEVVSPDVLSQAQRAIFSNLRIQANLNRGEWKAAVAAIGQEIGLSNGTLGIMPVDVAIADRPWDSLITVSDKIDLALALYARWKQTDDSLTASYLRFAFEEVLIDTSTALPSDFPIDRIRADRRLSFFLAHICVPVLMDTSGFFASSEELLNERLAILKLLQETEVDNLDDLLLEEGKIQTGKLLKSGLEVVNSNRVTVDENALFRWANRKYREAYSRYISLSAAGIGTAARYEDILEQINTATDNKGEFFSIPNSEADTLLLEILLNLKEQFLSNPQYGLEYFLGKRIRHGTIQGHMRGPAETANLITERRGPSFPYEKNTYWLENIAFKDFDHKERASAAFDRFSEKYDQLISEVRDEYLHVKSKQHELGLFGIAVTAPQFHVLKSVVRADFDFDQFVRVAFQVFWRLLGPSLASTRHFLGAVVKDKVVQLYGELQADVAAAATNDESCHQLSIAIQSVSTEVQRELDIVASWFDRVEAQHGAHTFTLEQAVDIAIYSVLNSLTTFRPTINRDISGNLSTSSAVLIVLWEFLFVVLDNVYRRARVGTEPEIALTCTLDSTGKTLFFRTSNSIGREVDCEDIKRRLALTREKIAVDDILRDAGADRGSGLMKMASLCKEFSGSQLTFAVNEDRTFVTELTIPVVLLNNDMFSFKMPEAD